MDNQVGVPNTDHRPVPEIDDIVLTIDQFHVCHVKFNRLGTLIAAGGSNGSLAVVDFTTKTTSNVWNAHALGVTSLGWTRDGSKLFSSGLDNVLVISDVVNGIVLKRMHIGTFILSAALNPRLNSKFLIHTQFGVKIGSLDSSNTVKICEKEAFSTLNFDHRGKYILAGTSKGQIKAFTLEGKCVSSAILDSLQSIRYIHPTRRFNLVIVVASDMFIRVYELDELLKWKSDEVADTVNTLYDPTCKTLWHSACASGDSEYVAALASTAHEVTIFERSTEAIVATLCQSKKEIPLGLEWHPAKPAVASVCNGNIFIWKQRPRPCWAAYAPDFTELGENLIYREKESEFDVDDEDFPKDDGLGKNQDEEFIDVESVTAPPLLCSSDDEDPNKKGGSVFIVNASPAVIPLKTTLPSQLRLKEGVFVFIPEIQQTNHVEQQHKKHKKKKRKKSEESYQHQNGIHTNKSFSPSCERNIPVLNYDLNERPISQNDSVKDLSQTTSRKSSDAFTESPPRAMRHRLKRKRPSKPSKSSTSTSPEKNQIYSRSSSPYIPRNSPVYSPCSPPPQDSPSLPKPIHHRSQSPININLSSSNATPTHGNCNFNEQKQPPNPQITLPQMPPLLPPRLIPKQVSSASLLNHPGLTNISSDDDDVTAEPPSKRQKRSSSSSSSSSAFNHAWDSD